MLARYVLGAEGAHSITRQSMHESLSGDTYSGRYIAADIRVTGGARPQGSGFDIGAYEYGVGTALTAPKNLRAMNQ